MDDKKLQATLKKMNVQPIQGIEEVNMFKSDGNVIHFSAPKGRSHLHTYPPIAKPLQNNSISPDLCKQDTNSNTKSTPPSPPTPSRSTVTAKTKSSLSWSPVF